MRDEKYSGEIIPSLRKSKTRRKVLEHLISIRPARSYPAEIAREIHLPSTDVCGALNGLPNRFKGDTCLVALGLVEKTTKDGASRYRATPLGCKAWLLLNK